MYSYVDDTESQYFDYRGKKYNNLSQGYGEPEGLPVQSGPSFREVKIKGLFEGKSRNSPIR